MYGVKIKLIAALMCISVITAGCAALQAVETGNTVANGVGQLLISEATAIAIQAGCKATATETLQQCYDANAAKVLPIAEEFANATAGTALVDIQKLLTAKIATLPPAEAAPLNSLLSQLNNYLASVVSSAAVLTAPAVAIVQTVAGWVADECQMYSPVLAMRVGVVKHKKR